MLKLSNNFYKLNIDEEKNKIDSFLMGENNLLSENQPPIFKVRFRDEQGDEVYFCADCADEKSAEARDNEITLCYKKNEGKITFADIEELAAQCRFRDCSHQSEPGCAVRAALQSGELAQDRWESYQHLLRENAYAEDSEGYLASKKKLFVEISKWSKEYKKHNP